MAAFFAAMLVALVAMVLVSCENEPDVQQAYPFTVETMPVPTRIVNGETVEIRCEGDDENEAIQTLTTLFRDRFGEAE